MINNNSYIYLKWIIIISPTSQLDKQHQSKKQSKEEEKKKQLEKKITEVHLFTQIIYNKMFLLYSRVACCWDKDRTLQRQDSLCHS